MLSKKKEQYLYVDLEKSKWFSPTTRSIGTRLILNSASMEIDEAFQGLLALCKKLGRNVTDLYAEYEEFIKLVSDEVLPTGKRLKFNLMPFTWS